MPGALRRRLNSLFVDPLAFTLSAFVPALTERAFDFYDPLDIGKPGDPLPEGYVNHRADEAHLVREASVDGRFKLIGRPGLRGLRWRFGPLWFEKYIGDKEPDVDPSGPRRMVIWQPIVRQDAPEGWKRSRLVMNIRLTGFAETGTPDDYWKNWTSHARRHRAKWLKQAGEWEITRPSEEEFLSAFRLASMDAILRSLFTGLYKEQRKSQAEHIGWIGLRRKSSGKIEAGFAYVDVPESRQSIHLVSFIHESARETSVGTGMMDWWFRHGQDRGLRWLDFDRFWAPGEPPSWKGFSKFKSQFGIRFLRWPYPLVRSVGNWREAFRK